MGARGRAQVSPTSLVFIMRSTACLRLSLVSVCVTLALSACNKKPDALQGGEPVAAPSNAPLAHEGAAAPHGLPSDAVHADVTPEEAIRRAMEQKAASEASEAGAPAVVHGVEGDTTPDAGLAAANALVQPTVKGSDRGVSWEVLERWPVAGEANDFRVRTWRLPAISMDGAGECVLYRFPGGGDAQANLHRWLGQFRGPDGTAGSVEADQAERKVNGLPSWLVRARGTYVSTGPSMDGPEQRFENYGMIGAVVMAPGDPAFVKCTGPFPLIDKESGAIVDLIDSLNVEAN